MVIQSRQPHGVPGQINIYVLDKDSDVSGFGAHNRLVVFKNDKAGTIEIREDFIGLPWSTETDRQRVACRTFQRQHSKGSKVVFQRSEKSLDEETAWHFYNIVHGSRAVA